MLTSTKRFLRQAFRKSSSINHEPLNRVSLIVVIVIDLFILFNVFAGLDHISRWAMSPTEAYPCLSAWQTYRDPKALGSRDYAALQPALTETPYLSSPSTPGSSGVGAGGAISFKTAYQSTERDRLGNVSPVCLTYAERKDQVNRPENRKLNDSINQKQAKIGSLEQQSRTIRSQYDSTLLEKIAGQGANQSINAVSAEKAKQTLDQNNASISTLKAEITALKASLINKSESQFLLNLVRDESKYNLLQRNYGHASFWYPSIQLGLQALFLLPLIAIALGIHQIALKRRAGLIALMSWHLLVIFFIPLLLKIFEFLQIGAVFKLFFDIVSAIFGRLLFLVNYLYILLVPLVGFGIIKVAQTVALNRQSQATVRVQNKRCLNCAKKIRTQDAYCPHCGYAQYVNCQACHTPTYKHLAHCRHCGALQQPAPTLSSALPPSTPDV
ncbi:MAG: hypothetical protein MH252_02625 [Thermosynechococcaceae cyanobacterium MS004]|nr:hypothetical protein [Thermosynechococcaceae cyanobacterium MS004]